MSIRICRFADLTPDEVSMLQRKLTDYYVHPPPQYYQISDNAAAHYTREVQPFHCDLVSRVTAAMSLLEIGCGSAHLCPQIEAAGGSYAGSDHSEKLLQNNRERFTRARFFQIGLEPKENFDIVASLYTLEHIVDPPSYLERMWSFCKPGGLIAIICPDFVDGESLPPSVFYGKTPRRFREKIASLAFGDALAHLFDLVWQAPRWKARARAGQPGAFWINLKPRILHGAEYSIDADAVHLPRLRDLVWWLEKRGASIVATSRSLKDVPASVLRHNCYAIARKPA